MNAERVIMLCRDVGSILVGLGGIVWQLGFAKPGPDAAVMAVLATIASIPLATNLRALRPSNGTEPTQGSSSPSPPSSAVPESSAPSQ